MSPLFAIGLLVSIMFCGLTVDVGRMELMRIQMQNASDAAAIGAELATENGLTGKSNWTANPGWPAQGQSDAAINGFVDGKNGATVRVVQNPTTGPYAGRYDAIQATITQTFSTVFMGALNGGKWTLTTTSVALVPPCAFFLGGASSLYSYSFQNASASLIANCPVYANSGTFVDGFARMWGFGLDVAGNSGGSGWTSQSADSGYGGAPPGQYPTNVQAATPDPLLSYIPTQPAFNGSCLKTSFTLLAGAATLVPGNYCGTLITPGLTILNANVTLMPGLYVITGGAKIINSTVTGPGVTLFFTQGNGASYGQVLFGAGVGSDILTLNAPTDTTGGGIPGILFFADRNWVSTGSTDFQFNTYGSFSGNGIWYLPNTGLYIWLNNNFDIPSYGGFVVRNTYFFGTEVHAGQNFSWLSGGSPFRTQSVLVQ